MPYIPQDERPCFHPMIEDIAKQICTEGDLNYVITSICVEFLKQIELLDGTNNYLQYNMIVGAIECAKMELYRRRIAPYENAKIVQNGDVY